MGVTPIQYTPAGNVTVKAAAALSGGTFAAVSADIDGRNPVAAPAAAGVVPLGVVAHDCPADGYVAVYRDGMYDVAADGAIAAGDPVAVADGGAATAAGEGARVVGVAVSNASGGTVTVALN